MTEADMGKGSKKHKHAAAPSAELVEAMLASPLVREAWAAALEAGAAAAVAVLRRAEEAAAAPAAVAESAVVVETVVVEEAAAEEPVKAKKARRKDKAKSAEGSGAEVAAV
ncbi:hypothetical protein GCM10007904_38270 [Oharaeibacter diazotrophicus]|nr:hypothetical protein GCM10007904_38270 [Oharaeibacter diazotrophicus]